MKRVDIVNGLDGLRKEFSEYNSIECRKEDVELIENAIEELNTDDAKKIYTLQFLLGERDKEIELLKKERQKLNEDLEIRKWAFEGLRSAYDDMVENKDREKNGY